MTKVKIDFDKAASAEANKAKKAARLAHIGNITRRWLYNVFEKILIKNGNLHPSRKEVNDAIRKWREERFQIFRF